jgi:hypothetical protein
MPDDGECGRTRWRLLRADVAWALAGGAVLLAYWFLRVLPGAARRPGAEGGDLSFQFYPDYAHLAERLRDGALPQWNPYAGQPFLATLLPGTFYPARLLLLVADTSTAMHVSTVAHLLLSLWATYALCRSLGALRLGAMAGAATFTGVHALSNVYTPPYLEGGAWLPVAGLALVRLSETGAWRWALLLGAALGTMVLTGCYQHVVYAVYAVAILGLALLCDRRRRGRLATWSVAGKVAVAGLLACVTAAPQALPTLAWSAETVRSGRALTDLQIDPYPFPWRSLARMFAPPSTYDETYVSIPVAALALLGCVVERRFGAVLLVATVTAMLLVVGRGTPAFVLFRMLPGFAAFRGPHRVTFLLAILAALGAAFGVSRLERLRAGGRTGGTLALAVVCWMLFAPPRLPMAFPWTASPDALGGPSDLMQAVVVRTGTGRTVLPGEAAEDGIAVKHATLHHVRGLQDYNPLSSRRLGAYLDAVFGLPPPRPDDPDFFLGWVQLNRPVLRPELLDMIAVRSVLLKSFVPPPGPRWRRSGGVGHWTLYESSTAFPRAFTVGRARLVVDDSGALAAITEPGFDARREGVLSGEPERPAIALPDDATSGPIGDATIVDDSPERVVVDVEASRPGVLVLADPFAPGWSATVNGGAVRLWCANALARAVLVPAGRSRVEFVYHAPALAAGLVLTSVGWSAVLVVALVRRGIGRRGSIARTARSGRSHRPFSSPGHRTA